MDLGILNLLIILYPIKHAILELSRLLQYEPFTILPYCSTSSDFGQYVTTDSEGRTTNIADTKLAK